MAKARKIVHTLYVNDEDEKAPVYRIRLDDASINEKAIGAYKAWDENKEIVDAVAAGEKVSEEDTKKLSAVWRGIIVAATSEEAYAEIVDYLRDGEDVAVDEMLVITAPIVVEIIDVLDSVLSAGNSRAYAKYLNDRKAPKHAVI